MRTSKKILSVLLTIVVFIGMFSCATTVFAEDLNEYSDNKAYQETLLTESVESDTKKADIICEVPEKRDEYSKTYKRADGSFTSVISRVPIHKYENGEWEEIDNTLNELDGAIANADGAFDIEFPETITEDNKIIVTNNENTISFSLNEIESADGVVSIPDADEKDVVSKDLEKTVSEITYENINEDTDLQYIVSSNFVKENIIVNNKDSLKSSYSFSIEKGELSAILVDKNLILKNSEDEIVFSVPSPVMSDAEGAVSYDIDVAVKGADKSVLTLIYTPSQEWLESDERVYPVKIDPVIILPDSDDVLIEDTAILMGISEGCENKNYSNSVEGYVYNRDYAHGEVLVKINDGLIQSYNLPNITVTDVNYYGAGLITNGNVLLKAINGSWDSKTITYNQVYSNGEPTGIINYDNTIVDYYTGKPETTHDKAVVINFNITGLFNQWLNGERDNHGFAIVAENENTAGVMMLAGEYAPSGSSIYELNTFCSIDYVDTSCANDAYEYLTQQIGRAGEVNVNTFSRGLSLSRFDMSMDGLRMPVSVGFNYNPATENFFDFYDSLMGLTGEEFEFSFFCGENWCPSYVQFIISITDKQHQFFTQEGTVVTFNEKTETITEGEGENQTTSNRVVFETDETSDSGYELEVIEQTGNITAGNLKVTNPNGDTLYFNDMGFVSEIRESEPNADGSYDKISIVYDDEYMFRIDYVVDGIGRKYDYIYDNQTGFLSQVKCFTASGTPIKAGTTNHDLSVSYGYDANGNLTTVIYPDGETVTYAYDSNGNLIKVTNIDGYNVQYTYDSLGKVICISEYAGDTPGNTITLSQLSDYQVKVTDGYNGTETYQFGKDGRLNYTFDEKGNYLKSGYALAKDENVFSISEWEISAQNLLKNGSFEEGSAIRQNRAKYWSTEFETVDLPSQQVNEDGDCIGYNSASFGEKAYLISSENNCTEFVSQTIDVFNNSSYTFSVFVRSEVSGELTLKIKGVNASGNIQNSDAVTVTSTEGWERYSVTYTPNNFVPEQLTVCIGFENGSGTYYVDCAQLESGLGLANYNLVQNGSFNNGDEYWSNSEILSDLISNQYVNAVKLPGGLPVCSTETENTGITDHISATTQTVKLNGKKGDVYSVGGWFKGIFDDNYIYENAPTQYVDIAAQPTSSSAQIKVTYSYLDDSQQVIVENFAVDFSPNNGSWQYAVDSFMLKGDTDAIDVTVIAKNIPSDSFATGIELSVDSNSISFTLEEDTEDTQIPEQEDSESETTSPEECPCEDCEDYDCSCRCESADVCACVQCLRRSDVEITSEDGKTVTTQSFDGEKYMQSAVTYSEDMNNVISETDENNISSGYAYNECGSITSFTDGSGNSITYQNNAMGYLTLAESAVSGLSDNAEKLAINYVYDGDLLQKVTQGNVQYTYEYDPWGQLEKVLVDNETLICYNYGDGVFRTRVTSIVFGSSEESGFTVKYCYNGNNVESVEKYRMISGENDSITYYYAYDNLGNLVSITDTGTGHFISYTDDGIIIKDGQNGNVIYETKEIELPEDDNSTLISETREIANGTSYNHKIYESSYSNETGKTTEKEAVSHVIANTENSFTYDKTIGTQTVSDWFGRNEAVTVMTKDPVDTSANFASISSEYSYVTNGDVTTNLVSTLTNVVSGGHTNTVNYSYTYDSNGRITNVSAVSGITNLNGASQYFYDEAGQLIREITGSNTYEYAYDSKGNITSRKVYSGGTLARTDTFTYGENAWKDRLTGYNGETVTYDSIGNPTSYRGATLTWRGRELTGYQKGNEQISYSYDVDGMRYGKVVKTNGVESARYDYVYSDGTLILLTYTANEVSQTARFVYDSWGEPRGFMLNDSATYLYLKNAQGDITGIVDENGAVLLTYSYTAWGEVTYSATNMQSLALAVTLSKVNPFTYRGYCYDYDIGMYYLQSRYYDPEICRFINADSTEYLGATGTLLSYNLFAYCENDGVNFVDETGTWAYDVHAGYYKTQNINKTNRKDGLILTEKISKTSNSKFVYSGRKYVYIPYIGDSKYYGTYYWAIECGISADKAKIIAYHCNGVDNLFKGVSWLPYLGDQSWHFNTNWGTKSKDSRDINSNAYIKKAKEAFNKGNIEDGLKKLGMALHPIQDKYAHTREVCTYNIVPITALTNSGRYETYYVEFWYHPKKNKKGVFVDSAKQRSGQLNKAKNETKKILNEMVKCYPILKK